ncbi:hypothetical protein [Flavobacterium lipolyticum]|uniref:Restriction endonuclease n=1 Tax=Flavobacterium lipolyticum TaxID=2893754 RepID=A0ABS8M6F3_9FLAO|nr:hypothetical protein [Flavobacterium sp. F-126]MCC9020422.1 hypothetical protein [Flavobacterium sp. F-126]
MLTKNMIDNCKKLFQLYIPNLLTYYTEKDFLTLLENLYSFTLLNDGKTANSNFVATFLMLVEEVKNNSSHELRNELGYFNYLLGQFEKVKKNKEFKNLVKGVINNFEKNDFKNVLAEIAVCLHLSTRAELVKYERVLQNKKSIDFEFKDDGNNLFLVEVYNIDYNSTKYEIGKPFEKFICERLEKKFNDKSANLDNDLKSRLLIFPVIHGLTIDIVRENKLFLTTLNKKRFYENGFNSFNPMSFAKVQGTYFDLFTMEEIAEGELKR